MPSPPPILKKGLAVTPFVSLLPTQDLAPLISSASIDTASDDLDAIAAPIASYKIVSRELEANENGQYSHIIDYVVSEFASYTDEELDELQFKRQPPIRGATQQHNPVVSHAGTQIENLVEERIYNAATAPPAPPQAAVQATTRIVEMEDRLPVFTNAAAQRSGSTDLVPPSPQPAAAGLHAAATPPSRSVQTNASVSVPKSAVNHSGGSVTNGRVPIPVVPPSSAVQAAQQQAHSQTQAEQSVPANTPSKSQAAPQPSNFQVSSAQGASSPAPTSSGPYIPPQVLARRQAKARAEAEAKSKAMADAQASVQPQENAPQNQATVPQPIVPPVVTTPQGQPQSQTPKPSQPPATAVAPAEVQKPVHASQSPVPTAQSQKHPRSESEQPRASPQPSSSPVKRQFIQPDLSLSITALKSLIFQLDEPPSDEQPGRGTWLNYDKQIVSLAWLSSLQDHLFRVLGKPIFEQLDLEFLTKVQSVCFISISESLETPYSAGIQSEAGPNTHDSELALVSIVACKIMLLVLKSKQNEKKLFVDEYFQSIIDLNYSFVELVIPKNASFTSSIISIHGSIASCISDNLFLLSDYIVSNRVDEQFLTRLEYLSIYVIFPPGSSKYIEYSKHENFQVLESLRWASAQLLTSIFRSHPDQRQFILEEIVGGYGSSTACTPFKLFRGGSIQMTSALLLNLIQCHGLEKVAKEASEVLANQTIQASKEADNGIGEGHDSLLESRFRVLKEEIAHLFTQSQEVCHSIAAILIAKIIKQSSSSDLQFRSNFETLINDLLYLLPFPEWSASESLLSVLMKELLKLIDVGSNIASNIETYVLEVVGIIGIKIVINKHNEVGEPIDRNLYFKLLEFVQLQRNKNLFYEPSWKYLLLRCLTKEIEDEKMRNTERSSQMGSTSSNTGGILTSDGIPSSGFIEAEHSRQLDSLLELLADGKSPIGLDAEEQSIIPDLLIQKSSLYQQYPKFVGILIHSLNSIKIKTRSKAIKILSSLNQIDSKLIQSIQQSIISKLSDSSPMVRDSVLDLLSNILKPELIGKFYQAVCETLADSSIQVRKKSIKLVREMYDNCTGEPSFVRKVRTFICTRLLRRLEDEEDAVVDQSTDLLSQFLLKNTNDWVRIQIMMDIVSSPVNKVVELFEKFINDAALPKESQSLKKIVEQLVDFVVLGEVIEERENALRLLSMIVKCNGQLLTQDQLISLQPILVDDGRDSECFYTLQILKFAIMEVSVLRSDFLKATEQSILKKLTKYSSRELNEAMPCIWKLCKLSGNTAKLANASISCLKQLRPYISQAKKNSLEIPRSSNEDARIRKLLNLVGGFGKFGSFEQHRSIFLKSNVGLKENESVTSLLAKVVLFFCTVNDEEKTVKRTAIKNIVGICTSHPNLFVSEAMLNVLDGELRSSSPEKDNDNILTKIVIIEGIIEFLEKEDNDSRKRQQLANNSEENEIVIHPASKLEGNTKFYVHDSICASITQRFTPSILPLCFYDQDNYSYIPIKFLQLVVKLGFANPKMCISSIIALESTTNAFIKSLAIEMHKDLFDKHESLTDTSYPEAVRIAVHFRKKNGNLYKERFFLKNLYSIVSYKRASRKKFIQSITKLFSPPSSWEVSHLEGLRDVVTYTTVNLSTINFAALEDVYLIIHQIDKLVLKEAMDIFDRIKAAEGEDIEQKEKKDIDIHSIPFLMATQIFISLISFKLFLESSYGISRAQMEMFNPARAVDADLKLAPKVMKVEDYILDSCVTENELESSENSIRILSNFVERMNFLTN